MNPLYRRVARDLINGKPMVMTTHVVLCDNRYLRCGSKKLGNGDDPSKNLYWGGGSGFRAQIGRARGFRRIFLDRGDGRIVLERVVYEYRIKNPSPAWRRLGVVRPFSLLLVGLAYRGRAIGSAMAAFINEIASEKGPIMDIAGHGKVATGGRGHVVGYAGHNHLMDVDEGYHWPVFTRRASLGFFALACRTAPYMASRLTRSRTHALLLTRVLIYPGAFTIEGLARGLALRETKADLFMRGVRAYARRQKRSTESIRQGFTHDGRRSYWRRYFGRNPLK